MDQTADGVTPQTAAPTPLPTATPVPERTLVICLGQEPDSLYPYGSRTEVAQSVLQAVYDGPFDPVSFDFQPVILEKTPNLADGDSVIQPATVTLGDLVIDAGGILTALQPGTLIRPAGCTDPECALEYDGSASIEMDQVVVTFRLLSGLTWSDGAPLTADDSVYSYQLDAHPDTPTSKFLVDRTAAYEAVDNLTLRWTGVPGFMDATYFANVWTPYPEHIWGRFAPSDLLQADESSRRPLGWGPYQLESWTPGESIRLRKNENYHRAVDGLPAFDNLLFRFVGQDPESTIQQLLSGECDLLDRSTLLDSAIETLLRLDEEGQLTLQLETNLEWEHVAFGIVPASYEDGINLSVDRPDFFGDARVRRAIALCMDRQTAVNTVLFGRSPVLDNYVPSQHPLYNQDAERYGFDVEAGSALLNEAGWIDHDEDPTTPRVAQGVENVFDGTPLEFTYLTTEAPQRAQVAALLVESLAQCGIRANLEFWEPGTYYEASPEGPLFGRRFDMGQFAWRVNTVPPCFLYLSEAIPGDPVALDENGARKFIYGWGGWNLTGYGSEEFDIACQKARSALSGQEAYETYHLLAQEIFARDLPVIPLYLHLKAAATRPDFCNFVLDPTSDTDLWNLESFDYGANCPGSE